MLEEALHDAEDKGKKKQRRLYSTPLSNRKESTPKTFSWKVPRWRKENVYHVSATDEEKKA